MIKVLKRNSLLSVLLLGWIAVQVAVVQHEFSPEHFVAGSNHLCLSQVGFDDDLVVSAALSHSIPEDPETLNLIIAIESIVTQPIYPQYHNRAPPTIS